jgi:GntR family transcriptional regulator
VEDAPYLRLAATLRRLITSGVWPPGYRVPSARSLGREFSAGRGTVEHAMAQLRREGLIEGRRGARAEVVRPAPRDRTVFDPRGEWPYKFGETATGIRRADEDLAARLQVPERTRLTWTRRECLGPDGWAAMLETTYRRGVVPSGEHDARVSMFVDELAPEEAHLLGLYAGATVLRMTRTRYAADGRALETSDLVLRADRWRIAL